MEIQALRIFEHAFLQRQMGLLREEDWAGWEQTIRLSVNLPGVGRHLDTVSVMFKPEFLALVEEFRGIEAHVVDDFLKRRSAVVPTGLDGDG